MRVRILIILTSLSVSAAACATVEAPAAAPPEVVSSAPAPVDGYDWFYHLDDGEARLVYGLAESDDLRLGLDCRANSGRLMLSTIAGPEAKPEILVEAGGETERFPARSEPSELHDGVLLTADAAAGALVFQRFRRLGWIARWQDGEREAYAPHPASRPDIERFFAFCG